MFLVHGAAGAECAFQGLPSVDVDILLRVGLPLSRGDKGDDDCDPDPTDSEGEESGGVFGIACSSLIEDCLKEEASLSKSR